MPLEVKAHTVSHLKAFTSGLEPFSGHGHGSTFIVHHTVLKRTQYASYRPNDSFMWTYITVWSVSKWIDSMETFKLCENRAGGGNGAKGLCKYLPI